MNGDPRIRLIERHGPGLIGDGPSWLILMRDEGLDGPATDDTPWERRLEIFRVRFPAIPPPRVEAAEASLPTASAPVKEVVLLARLLLHPTPLEALSADRVGGAPRGALVVRSPQHDVAGEALSWATRIVQRSDRQRVSGSEMSGRDELDEHLKIWWHASRNCASHSLTISQLEEAHRLGIPTWLIEPRERIYQLGTGSCSRWISSSSSDRDSAFGAMICQNKLNTKLLLEKLGIPTPIGTYVPKRFLADSKRLSMAATRQGFPCVVKPVDCDQGQGVHIGIRSEDELMRACEDAGKKTNTGILIEAIVLGEDHRVAAINGELAWVVRREPPEIVGDGQSSIHALIEAANVEKRRLREADGVSGEIPIDTITTDFLNTQSLRLESVLDQGRVVRLRPNANISTGGRVVDVTHRVHPSVHRLAERISRTLRLDAIGIDLITPDIAEDLGHGGGAVIEVNFRPQAPAHRATRLVERLFPDDCDHSVPARAGIWASRNQNREALVGFLQEITAHGAGKEPGNILAAPVNSRKVLEDIASTLGLQLTFYRHPRQIVMDATARSLTFLMDDKTFLLHGLPLPSMNQVMAWIDTGSFDSPSWNWFRRSMGDRLQQWWPSPPR